MTTQPRFAPSKPPAEKKDPPNTTTEPAEQPDAEAPAADREQSFDEYLASDDI